MKARKTALLLLMLLLCSWLMFACAGTGGTEGGGGTGDEGGSTEGGEGGSEGSGDTDDEPEEIIFSADTVPTLIIGDSSVTTEYSNKLYTELKTAIGTAPAFSSDNVEERDHEIIIGKSTRALSVKAYNQLGKIVRNGDTENTGFLIMSDGYSVAIAFCDDGYDLALDDSIDYFIEKCVQGKTELAMDKGVYYSTSYLISSALQKQDKEVQEAAWAAFRAQLDPEYADEVIEELGRLYALYESRAITWFASLYDPGVGGFYHSNSGRDTYGYLPDAESCAKIFALIKASGMIRGHSSYADVLPEKMKQEVGDFIYGLQTEDGYFYHPQWESVTLSRRGRDLSWCVDILDVLGRKPKYTTITGVQGEGDDGSEMSLRDRSAVVAASKVIAASNVPDHLKSEEAFRAYLEAMDIQNNSYNKGNELSSQGSQIRAMGLGDVLIEFLNENQFEHNGLWHNESDYYGINGLMKISGIYSSNKASMPNADKAVDAAIDAILSEEPVGSVVSFYNPWAAVKRITDNQRKYGGEEGKALADEIVENIRARSPEAIRVTTDKVSTFKREDGAFSYYPGRSVAVSQNAPVCVPYTVESDVAGACISITGITGYIFDAMELEAYRVPIYGKYELSLFVNTINSLLPITKEKPIPKPIDFEDGVAGEKPSGIDSISVKSEGGSILVENENDNNFVTVVTTPGVGDNLTFKIRESGNESNGFTFSGKFRTSEILAVGEKKAQSLLRLQFQDADKQAYRLLITKTEKGIAIKDTSSNTIDDNVIFTEIGEAALGEWFTVKVECTVIDGTLSVKLYFNDQLVGTSTNYFKDGHEGVYTNVDRVTFYFWKSTSMTFSFDDIYFVDEVK